MKRERFFPTSIWCSARASYGVGFLIWFFLLCSKRLAETEGTTSICTSGAVRAKTRFKEWIASGDEISASGRQDAENFDPDASIVLDVEADIGEEETTRRVASVSVRFRISTDSLTAVLKTVCEKDGIAVSDCRSLGHELRILRSWIMMSRPETIAVRQQWKHVRKVSSWTHSSKRSPVFFSHIPSMMWPPPTRELALSELLTQTKAARVVAVVVPYRDREAHLVEFVRHMTRTLGMTISSDQNISGFDGGTGSKKRTTFVIFVVEQDDRSPFNRGWLMNVGFHLATANRLSSTTGNNNEDGDIAKSWPKAESVIFHDVDILPAGDVVPFYARAPPPGCVFHLINPMWPVGPRLMYGSYGGVNTFRSEDFAAINGFPNDRFGWGLEDDCLRQRASLHQPYSYTTLRPKDGHFTFLSHDSNRNDSTLASFEDVLRADLGGWRSNGLTNLEYKVNQVDVLAPAVAKIKVSAV